MGDPRKIRSKYSGPRHPWERQRIENEKELSRTYGLANKKEIWKINSKLKSYREQAKKLSALKTEQAEKETDQLLKSLINFGILGEKSSLDAVLDIPVASLLERRLQTVLVKKKLARTPRQARQFIVHGHIMVDGKKISSPSYMVKMKEEEVIAFATGSKFDNNEHPERAVPERKAKPKVRKVEVRRDKRSHSRAPQKRAPFKKGARG